LDQRVAFVDDLPVVVVVFGWIQLHLKEVLKEAHLLIVSMFRAKSVKR